jgi:GTP-binding protein Era
MPRHAKKSELGRQENQDFRSGMVSIVGRPNVGKSTLLNTILDEKVSIVSKVPQTTRNRIRGIYNDERGQIVFIDTPGLVLGKDKLDRLLKKSSLGTINDVDCIVHLVDATEAVGEEEEEIVRRLNTVKAPVIVGLNKVDHHPKHMDQYIQLWQRIKNAPVQQIESLTLMALSGRDGTNVDKLLDVIFEKLPQGPAFYPIDTICDVPKKIVVADIIREKLFRILKQELPHSIAVIIELMQPKRKKIMHIKALILVERESQKEIVIGKNGAVLKKVGQQAREELEELLESKIFLETHVKMSKNWRDDTPLLQELGYDPQEG